MMKFVVFAGALAMASPALADGHALPDLVPQPTPQAVIAMARTLLGTGTAIIHYDSAGSPAKEEIVESLDWESLLSLF